MTHMEKSIQINCAAEQALPWQRISARRRVAAGIVEAKTTSEGVWGVGTTYAWTRPWDRRWKRAAK